MTDIEPANTSEETNSVIGQVLAQTGFPSTVTGRLQRWAAQILGGIIAHPAYAAIRQNLDTVEGRSRVNMIVADEVARRLIKDDDYMERAKARFAADFVRKNDNLEAVASKALEIGESEPDAKLPDDDTVIDLNPDWINTFTREAEDASSDELRERLARILAGEARSPGSFSRSTVRIVAELDKSTLESFQTILAHRVNDHIPKFNDFTKGTLLNCAREAENAGLVSGLLGFMSKTITIPPSGSASYPGNQLALVIEGEPNATKNVACLLLTRTGSEIASLLTPTSEIAALERVARLIDKAQLSRIMLGPIIERDSDNLKIRPFMAPWSKDAP